MKKTILVVAGACVLGLGACERAPRLEVRTFPLENADADRLTQLVDPYVYSDRPGAPGTMSWTEGGITVRETPDNLDRIERVIREYDLASPGVRLVFQLIEADGFTDPDPRIADVQAELERLFRFGGYRLAGEATVVAAGGRSTTSLSQTLALEGASTPPYRIEAYVRSASDGVELGDFQLKEPYGTEIFHTTVTVHAGQTLVLGSSPGPDRTLLLTVRAEAAS